MIINSPTTPKIIDDYDFIFINGQWSVTIDESAGDTIDTSDPHKISIYIAPKPSMADPSQKTPAETQTLYTNNLNIVQHKQREVFPASPELREQIKDFILEKAKTTKTVH